MTYSIDNLDERIIYRLQEDARGTNAPAVAEEMDVSASTVRKRIDRLEEEGIVRGYHADIDYEKCGRRLTSILECSVPAHERESVAQHAMGIPGVVNVREMMTGKGNLIIKTVGMDTKDITRVTRKLTNIGIVVENENLLHEEYSCPYSPFGPETDGGEKENPTNEDLVTVTVVDDAPVAGRSLQDSNKKNIIPENVLVVSVHRGDEVITPKGDTELQAGDVVRLFSSVGVSGETFSAFDGGSS